MNPRTASARTTGRIALQFWKNAVTPSSEGRSAKPVDRVLNGPTRKIWMDPWRHYLENELGVTFVFDKHVESIHCTSENTKVDYLVTRSTKSGAQERPAEKHTGCVLTYCIGALPIRPVARVVGHADSATLLNAEPTVRRIDDLRLSLEWMVGVQFFFRKDVSRWADSCCAILRGP
jgi:hypothetical protein